MRLHAWMALLMPLAAFAMFQSGPMLISMAKARTSFSVDERVAQFGPAVRERVASSFTDAGIDYPPRRLAFLAFKDERILEVYARSSDIDVWRRVRRYPILGMSGSLGPKTREGDLQVPEGVYRSEFLNANSRFHLSIRVNYPNAEDRAIAAREERERLGGDIMIHGSDVSIGCLAMGDEVAEDLFVLAAGATAEPLAILIAPVDFRQRAFQAPADAPGWWEQRYATLREALQAFPVLP